VLTTERRLAARLRPSKSDESIVGIEHEYRVVVDGEAVDFRTMIGELDLRPVGCDPSDPNARHLVNGLMVTADGREAEVVTPPIAIEPGCSWYASRWTSLGHTTLCSSLGETARLQGYSTHINVSVDGDPMRTAWLYARHFALPSMLLIDQPESPGLLVRPRPGRLEVGGEFAVGQQLRAALVFNLAAGAACAAAASARSPGKLPAAIDGDIAAAVERPGWYIDRRAFGTDLYRYGRDTIVFVDGVPARSGDVLVRAWEHVRDHACQLVGPDEIGLVDDTVEERRPIPLESITRFEDLGLLEVESPFAQLHERVHGDVRVRPVALTWSSVTFEVERATDAGYVVVPRSWLREFLAKLDDDELDDLLPAVCAASHHRRCPRRSSAPSVYGKRPDDGMLVPPEPRRVRRWRRWWPEALCLAVGLWAGLLLHEVGWWR
jgi:hypothetical protein